MKSSNDETKRQIAEKKAEIAELQNENMRYEDELRQVKSGNLRPIIESIAHKLGLIYPGERIFKDAE